MGSRQAENVIVGGGWSFLWVCVDCGFKPCKEAVEVVEQRDVVDADLWRGLVVCDRLNALPQAPGVSAVFEVAGYLYIFCRVPTKACRQAKMSNHYEMSPVVQIFFMLKGSRIIT